MQIDMFQAQNQLDLFFDAAAQGEDMDAGEWAGALTRNTYEARIEALAERLEAELQDY